MSFKFTFSLWDPREIDADQEFTLWGIGYDFISLLQTFTRSPYILVLRVPGGINSYDLNIGLLKIKIIYSLNPNSYKTKKGKLTFGGAEA